MPDYPLHVLDPSRIPNVGALGKALCADSAVLVACHFVY